MRTRATIPGDWRIDCSGMICPLCFLDLKRVEANFKTPMRYTYFLAKKLEGVIEEELYHSQKTFLPDKELRVVVSKLSKEIFAASDIRNLDVKSKLVIARRLRFDYASTVKQIARILNLDKEALEGYI